MQQLFTENGREKFNATIVTTVGKASLKEQILKERDAMNHRWF